jgi:hypothetical protein
LKKALYGLKQAPKAWYSRLEKYLQQQGFKKGNANNNLYIKVNQGSILLFEVYVDDIIFGSVVTSSLLFSGIIPLSPMSRRYDPS